MLKQDCRSPSQGRAPRAKLRPALLALACSALVAAPVLADPLVFDPLYSGSVATAPGAQVDFRRIDNAWHGSQVLWNEGTHEYGNGSAIGGFDWGTGLWGRADWQQVMSGGVTPVQQWGGIVDQINFGNARYNECYAGTWGAANLAPFFSNTVTGAPCSDKEAGAADQMNWATQFNGLIRITEAGLYNFSVLFDDGFFFRLIGKDNETLEIGRDFLNPRERLGFDQDLLLSAGLYGFELGSWNRLGAGVVDLRWSRDGGKWELVPVDNFAHQVPEPPALALLALAFGAAAWRSRRPAAQ
ncbi:MAG TPA: PEP-CTERM sorting domain-containing protein [Rubrivivax sp.]|nr:PEP-CTERM sorting domain-containing protein [Burkholderiales bacterium]HNU10928.1 PEP-CTERM sorting domain-containing protein [Rubrivivax sp.]